MTAGSNLKLGINGLGRIGKLTLWHHIARKYFGEIVVNVGRRVGGSLEDLAHYIEFPGAAFFKEHAFSKHKNTYFITLFHTHIGESHSVEDALPVICGNNHKDFHINTS